VELGNRPFDFSLDFYGKVIMRRDYLEI
jgi:hypothetical protein